ncbi:hypothetical protein CR513_40613, partial [Mucuna pruriens]
MLLTYKDESFKVFFIFYKCVQNEKVLILFLSKVTMGENLKMETFINFVKKVEFIIFLLQEYFNRIVLLKGKIDHLLSTSKQKLKGPPMNCGRCFILNTKDNLGRFDPKSNKGTFFGYFKASKAYRVYNSIQVRFNDSGDIQDKVRIRSTFKDQAQVALLSKLEPKNVEEAPIDKGWIKESIHFNETFAFVARLEVICILLSFVAHYIKWMLSVLFLNGIINEEVYVKQPLGFESDAFSNHVFKLKKSLYGLKQAPHA